jgi:hypothetical protein
MDAVEGNISKSLSKGHEVSMGSTYLSTISGSDVISLPLLQVTLLQMASTAPVVAYLPRLYEWATLTLEPLCIH